MERKGGVYWNKIPFQNDIICIYKESFTFRCINDSKYYSYPMGERYKGNQLRRSITLSVNRFMTLMMTVE